MCKKIKSCYLNYVVSILSSLDSCEASFTILPCTFLLFFSFLSIDLNQDDAHETLKDTPSHLYCVLDVYVYFVSFFFLLFCPLHSFSGTLLHEQAGPIPIYLANSTTQLKLSFSNGPGIVCVCVYM